MSKLFDQGKALAGKVVNALSKRKQKKVITAAQYRRGETGTVKASTKAQAKDVKIVVKSKAPAEEGQTATRRATKRYESDHILKPTKRVKNARAKSLRLSRGGNTRKRTRGHTPMKGR